jgi:thioredoxin-related protein
MKLLILSLFSLYAILSADWQLDFQKARQTARSEHKYILLNFSGSDWCGPCIQMNKEIFDTEIFEQYAKEHLVLVNADFPRSRKHALSEEQQKKNDQLAEDYNKKGIFPLTILINAEGKPIKAWEGFPAISADEFTKQLQSIVNAGK